MAEGFIETEFLDPDEDNGTIVGSVYELASEVVGHRIVQVEQVAPETIPPTAGNAPLFQRNNHPVLAITLDTGAVVYVEDTDDCCAYTEVSAFLWNADKIDHVITGVRTENGYRVWSFYADMGDVLALTVGWSAGNPFYYGYGFNIRVDNFPKLVRDLDGDVEAAQVGWWGGLRH